MGVAGRFSWCGLLVAIQPRVQMTRSFDQRRDYFRGFVLRVRGQVADEVREFTVSVGEKTVAKHRLRAGHNICGAGFPLDDPETEGVDLHRVSGLQVLVPASPPPPGPPWRDIPPPPAVYIARGYRRLAARTYERECSTCQWGCRMPVEMILDHWRPDRRKFRTETFCFGPLSCPLYRPGPTRKVPGRKGQSWEEEDWIDEEAVSHRGPDD